MAKGIHLHGEQEERSVRGRGDSERQPHTGATWPPGSAATLETVVPGRTPRGRPGPTGPHRPPVWVQGVSSGSGKQEAHPEPGSSAKLHAAWGPGGGAWGGGQDCPSRTVCQGASPLLGVLCESSVCDEGPVGHLPENAVWVGLAPRTG